MTNLKQLAQLGDLDALATLLNRAVEHKHITAKVSLNDGCLKIILESEQVPEETASAILIDRELMKLHLQFINTVEIYGQKIGEFFPIWHEQFSPGAKKDARVPLYQKFSNITHKTPTSSSANNQWQLGTWLSNFPTQVIDKKGYRALAGGFFLSILIFLSGQVTFILSYFKILVHELGHSFTLFCD